MFAHDKSAQCLTNFSYFFNYTGSPFHVNVRDRLDASHVNVKMSSTMRANTLQEIVIDGQTAGPGNPSIDITDSHGKSLSSFRE